MMELKPVLWEAPTKDSIDSLLLPPYLQDAYKAAEKFCSLLGQRVKGAGFLKTLLLRRIGSTIYAGQQTTEKMLHEWGNQSRIIDPSLFEENDDQQIISTGKSDMKKLTGDYKKVSRDDLKQKVGKGELRLLLGTDAAS